MQETATGGNEVEQLAASLSAYQRDTLVAIRDGEGHHRASGNLTYGLGVKDVLDEWYGEDTSHPRLYMNLDELETLGLIEKSQIDDRTNGLALTPGGEAVLSTLADRYGGTHE